MITPQEAMEKATEKLEELEDLDPLDDELIIEFMKDQANLWMKLGNEIAWVGAR